MSKIDYHENDDSDLVSFEKTKKPSKQRKTDENISSRIKSKKKGNKFRDTIRGKNHEELY
jgi:hypothetical protein